MPIVDLSSSPPTDYNHIKEGAMVTTQERINRAAEILTETLKRAEQEATTYESRAARERWLHQSFSAALAVLAVAAPAVVTYQTQVQNTTLSIIAIVVTAIAGAGTALQATFRWGGLC